MEHFTPPRTSYLCCCPLNSSAGNSHGLREHFRQIRESLCCILLISNWNIVSEWTGTLPQHSLDFPLIGLQISFSDKTIFPFPLTMFPISGPDLQNSHVHSSRCWNISRLQDSHSSSQNVTFVTLTFLGG